MPSVSTARLRGGKPVSSSEAENGKIRRQERAFLTSCTSPLGSVVTRFTRSVHDFGKASLTSHIFLSWSSDSWNAELAGSEIPTRTYTGAERRAERDSLETHAIQVLDKPSQILPLQIWNSILVIVPAKEVAELLVKVWRSSVEATELLQGIGLDHGNVRLGLAGSSEQTVCG